MLTSDFFQEKIEKLKASSLYRSLKIFKDNGKNQVNLASKKYISFCSNDYLGLAENKAVKKAAIKAIETHGLGGKSSRYVTGNNALYQKLEKSLANLKKTDDAIVFGSGYLAGIGVIPALVQKNDLIIADKLIHSCLISGATLSGAKMLRFEHNDMNSAKEILQKNRQNYQKCLIITETVFSMDGDLGEVEKLLDLAAEFDCLLLSDDAHGIGILKQNKSPKGDFLKRHLQMGTLSKAVGGYGGYVCASKTMIDYLRNFARSAVFSTALPPAILAGNWAAVEIIKKDQKLAKKALENANYFCELLGLPEAKSCIVIIIIGEAKRTLEIAKNIAKKGFLISAIRPPTVAPGTSRLRITFNSNHKKSDIKKLANLLIGAKN